MYLKHLAALAISAICVASNAAPSRICVDYSSRVPDLSVPLCEGAQLRDMNVRTVKGRSIWGRDMGASQAALRVLVIGAIHGDEISSGSVVFHWIQLAGQKAAATGNDIQWRFIPVLNPDGLFSKPSKRVNANGVDLNRNFPTPNWEREAKTYWESRTRKDPRRWPGSTPLSEPESRFIKEQMESFKPNLIVSVHAPYGLLDFDGPVAPPSRLGRLFLDQLGVYPGSLGNYGGIHKGVPVVTIELPNANKSPKEAETRAMWLDLQRWISQRLMAGS